MRDFRATASEPKAKSNDPALNTLPSMTPVGGTQNEATNNPTAARMHTQSAIVVLVRTFLVISRIVIGASIVERHRHRHRGESPGA